MGRRFSFIMLLFILPFLPLYAFADSEEEPILAETDYPVYVTGDMLIVSGFVEEKKMPIIAMRVYDPDGIILSANNVELEEDNSFSKILFLDPPFYEKVGTYTINFDYGKDSAQIDFEIIADEEIDDSPIIEEPSTPEVLIMVTDESVYHDNEFIVIAGIVSSIQDPSVLIGIYDPFGTPTGFYFAEIDSDLEFSTSFLAKEGLNFKTEGTYSVVAHYGESEYTINFDFVNSKESDAPEEKPEKKNPEIDVPEIEEPETEKPETKEPEIKAPEKKQPEVKQPEIKKPELVSDDEKPKDNKSKEISKIKEKKPEPKQSKVYNNLSVKDIELGKMLNLITLNCDRTDYIYSISYYDGMGPALIRLCKYNEAIFYFDKFLLEDPNNIEVLTNKGTALSKLGFFDEAISHFDSALSYNPNYFPALNNKANTLAERGHLEEAVSLYTLATNSNPDIPLLKNNLEKTFEKMEIKKNQCTTCVDSSTASRESK